MIKPGYLSSRDMDSPPTLVVSRLRFMTRPNNGGEPSASDMHLQHRPLPTEQVFQIP